MLALTSLGAMELGAFSARDVVMTGRGAPGEKPYAVKFGRLTLDKVAGAKAREAAIEDFALDSADGGHVALRRLALRGLDFNTLLTPGEAPDLAARPRRGGGRRRRSARRRRRWARQIRDWRA